MRESREYIIGIDGQRFIKAKEFSRDHIDDAAALTAANKLLDGHEVELWDCGRLVARLSPNGQVASPDLVPFSVAPADSEKQPSKLEGSVPLGRVSELAKATSQDNPLLLGW